MKNVLPDIPFFAGAVGKEKIIASAEFKTIWLGAGGSHLFLADLTKKTFEILNWCDIARVSLKNNQLTIYFTSESQPVALSVDKQAAAVKLLTVINESVTASVVTSSTIGVPGGTVCVSLRRRPNGDVFSQILCEAGVDFKNPDIINKIAVLEEDLLEAVGFG